jgi:MFS family permease
VLPWVAKEQAVLWLLCFAVGYHVCAGLVVPAWNSWIAEIVPAWQRGAFFGRRNRVRTALEFSSALAAGGLLALAHKLSWEATGFLIVFLVAALARLVSAHEISAMHEPPYQRPSPADAFTFRQFLYRSPRANFGRFTIYVALFLAATHVASPFFTPFMLRDLGFGYGAFTLASVAFIAAQATMMRAWGRVGDSFGNRRVLAITGFSLPVLPILWVFATNLVAVLVLQIVAGLLWAGFHLSVANFLFDTVTPQKRARCVAYYNTLTNAGLFLGAMAGGVLASYVPERAELQAAGLPLISGLQLVFVASGLLRLVATLALLPLVREVRPVEPGDFREVVMQIVGQSPLRGARLSVFGGAAPAESRDELTPTDLPDGAGDAKQPR